MAGGYVSTDVQLVELAVDGARRVRVVLKRARDVEIAALRAVAQVPGVGRPAAITSGDGWLVLPYYGDRALQPGDAVPGGVYDTLARVHAHHRGRPLLGVPVVDERFWQRLCLEVARPAVLGAGMAAAAAALQRWSADQRVLTALRLLPATLTHGDLHRGNVVLGRDGPTIIDWGNARIAPGGLDLAVLAAQADPDRPADERGYHATVAALTGKQPDPVLAQVEQHWAAAQAHVQYLTFAADHLGAARVEQMVDTVEHAIDRLGAAQAGV